MPMWQKQAGMTRRFELSGHSLALIEDIVSPFQILGRSRRNNRQMLNGMFWTLCSGAEWPGLSDRCGSWIHFISALLLSRRTIRSSLYWFVCICRSAILVYQTEYLEGGLYHCSSQTCGYRCGNRALDKRKDYSLGSSHGDLSSKMHLFCDSTVIRWFLCFV